MSLFSRWILGVDVEAEQAKSDSLDAQLRELNAEAERRGVITPEQRRASDARIESAAPVSDQIGSEFSAGWREGADNVSDAFTGVISGTGRVVGDAVAAPLWGVVRGLPWWAWVGLTAWGLTYFRQWKPLFKALLGGFKAARK